MLKEGDYFEIEHSGQVTAVFRTAHIPEDSQWDDSWNMVYTPNDQTMFTFELKSRMSVGGYAKRVKYSPEGFLDNLKFTLNHNTALVAREGNWSRISYPTQALELCRYMGIDVLKENEGSMLQVCTVELHRNSVFMFDEKHGFVYGDLDNRNPEMELDFVAFKNAVNNYKSVKEQSILSTTPLVGEVERKAVTGLIGYLNETWKWDEGYVGYHPVNLLNEVISILQVLRDDVEDTPEIAKSLSIELDMNYYVRELTTLGFSIEYAFNEKGKSFLAHKLISVGKDTSNKYLRCGMDMITGELWYGVYFEAIGSVVSAQTKALKYESFKDFVTFVINLEALERC